VQRERGRGGRGQEGICDVGYSGDRSRYAFQDPKERMGCSDPAGWWCFFSSSQGYYARPTTASYLYYVEYMLLCEPNGQGGRSERRGRKERWNGTLLGRYYCV